MRFSGLGEETAEVADDDAAQNDDDDDAQSSFQPRGKGSKGRPARQRYDDEDEEDREDEEEEEQEQPEEEEEDKPDPAMQEWEDTLQEWARLDQVLKRIHPKLKDTRTMVVDEEMNRLVKARRNPTLRFTATLMCGTQPYMHGAPVEKGSWTIPRVIIVTGHRGEKGNIGMNGIYERHPDDHHHRPVYFKTLTKRTMEEDVFMSRTAWRPGMITCVRIPAIPPYDGPVIMGPTPPGGLNFFLYFDNTQGCWCIGPKVGAMTRICARCPGCADSVPANLLSWECWDVGMKQWYVHRGLQAIKGGK